MTREIKLCDFLGLSKRQFFADYGHLNLDEIVALINEDTTTRVKSLTALINLVENKIKSIGDNHIPHRHLAYPSIMCGLHAALLQEQFTVMDILATEEEDTLMYNQTMESLGLPAKPVSKAHALHRVLLTLIALKYIEPEAKVSL